MLVSWVRRIVREELDTALNDTRRECLNSDSLRLMVRREVDKRISEHLSAAKKRRKGRS